MQIITAYELMRRDDTELGALFRSFNLAMARTKPFTQEWRDAVCSVESILRERSRRADLPRPR